MDLRHARAFVTVAELGTVSKAALRLRIAQPALSRQIIDLEQELGLRLFDRVGRRLLLTGEGEQLLAGCRVLLNYATALKEQAELLRSTWGPSVSWRCVSEPIRSLPNFSALLLAPPIESARFQPIIADNIVQHLHENVQSRAAPHLPVRPVRVLVV